MSSNTSRRWARAAAAITAAVIGIVPLSSAAGAADDGSRGKAAVTVSGDPSQWGKAAAETRKVNEYEGQKVNEYEGQHR